MSPRVTQENAFNYDKGVLAEILEPIMGKGLIPADLETWKPRRRAIVPAFHKAYIEAMIKMFGRCTDVAVQKLDEIAMSGQVIHALQMQHPLNHACSKKHIVRLHMHDGGCVEMKLHDALAYK